MKANRDNPGTDVSSGYLFFTFLKVGSISFGGQMGLLSVAQKILVDRDRKVDSNVFMNGISLASLLPGPMAVNTVTYIGDVLNSRRGAVASILGILIPASFLMTILSWLYFAHGYSVHIRQLFVYITGAVCAVIAAVGVAMYRKEVKDDTQRSIMAFVAFALLILSTSYFVTVGIIIAGIAIGFWNYSRRPSMNVAVREASGQSDGRWMFYSIAIALVVVQLSFYLDLQSWVENIYIKIAMVFSGMSLTLFGGGYVMIPIMQSLFVEKLRWVSSQEFVDGIAMSQMTPGPILVSATFIGYKVAGVTGAILATVSVFAPSGLLIVALSRLLKSLKNQPLIQWGLQGAKAVIVGMIFASVVKLFQSVHFDYWSIAVFVIALVLLMRFKVSPPLIIASSIPLGLIIEQVL